MSKIKEIEQFYNTQIRELPSNFHTLIWFIDKCFM
jgi:hypothetical protein